MIAALCLALTGLVTDAHTGRGLPSVEVSNGRDVAITDEEGRYTLPEAGRFVFVLKPSGWIAAGHTPDWYGPLNGPNPPAAEDFTLVAHRESGTFRTLVLTDPQPSNLREVDYLRRSIGEPLARQGAEDRADFAVLLGDITYDRPALYPPINAALSRLGIPWFPVNGNHDLDLGVAGEGAVAPYEALYGPSTYAFHWGPALLVALNDVRHRGGPVYEAGLLPDQWAFLRALLGRTPPSTPLVLFFHIPLFAADPFAPPAFPRAQRDRLFALLQPFQHVLLLSGHTHTQRRVTYGPADGWNGAAPLLEFNAAAACGGYWGGPTGPGGVPISTMSDGTPPGYALLSVSSQGFAIHYHRRPDLGPDDAPDASLGCHVPAVVAAHQGFVPFYANVYDADASWTVTAQIDDGTPFRLHLALSWDPRYAAAYLAQDAPGAVPFPHPRLPEPTLCFHLWRAFLPSSLHPGPHQMRITARSAEGTTHAQTKRFQVVEAASPPLR